MVFKYNTRKSKNQKLNKYILLKNNTGARTLDELLYVTMYNIIFIYTYIGILQYRFIDF